MRVKFTEVFQVNPDGMIMPKLRVQIGGVSMGPGVAFGGRVYRLVELIWRHSRGKTFRLIEIPDGTVILKGSYN